jgi:uncharacterized protein YbjT (DUF2867 family)
MSTPRLKMLAIGATGSIGTLVVAEAIGQGHTVRALVRSQARARDLPSGVQVAIGDLTQHETLAEAVADIDAIVFTHGADGGGKQGSEAVDYGGVRNILRALGSKKPRIAPSLAIRLYRLLTMLEIFYSGNADFEAPRRVL